MLQIFRLAPSMSPDIEPVVSSANTISTRGRSACGGAGGGDGGGGGSIRLATGGGVVVMGPAFAPRRWAAIAASPASTAPTIRLTLTHLSRFVSLVVLFMMATSRP